MRDCKSKCCGIKCPSEFDQELSDWCGGVRERGTQDKSRYGQFVNDMSECCKSESPVRPPGGGPQTGGGRVREREGERERVRKLNCRELGDLEHYCGSLTKMPIVPPPSSVDTKEECCRVREPIDMLREYPISNGYVEQTSTNGPELEGPNMILNLNVYTEAEIEVYNERYRTRFFGGEGEVI